MQSLTPHKPYPTGAFRQTWEAYNPRPEIERIVNDNPDDEAAQLAAMVDLGERNDAFREAAYLHILTNTKKSMARWPKAASTPAPPGPKPYEARREAAARQARANADQILREERNRVAERYLDQQTLLGRWRDLRRDDLLRLPEVYRRVALGLVKALDEDRLSAGKTVGEALLRARVADIFEDGLS